MPSGIKLEKAPSLSQAKDRSWSLFVSTIGTGAFLVILSEVLDRINNSDFQNGIDVIKNVSALAAIPLLTIATWQLLKYCSFIVLTEEKYKELLVNHSPITNDALERYRATIKDTPLQDVLHIFVQVSDNELLDFSDLISSYLDPEYGDREDLSFNNGMMRVNAQLSELILRRSEVTLELVAELLKSFRQVCEENNLDEEEFAWDVCLDFEKPE